MGAQAQVGRVQNQVQIARWSSVSRVAFRFSFAYLGLYCLATQIISSLLLVPKIDIREPGGLWPIRQVTMWTAAHIFHVSQPLVNTGSGSGDKTFDWVLAFCLLVFAALLTGIWSFFDRKREEYARLHEWFRLFIRFALAGQMFAYGMAKAVPMQMPFPYLTRLIQPFGSFSPMGVLWSAIGASPAYEVFTGCAEMLGGLLLIVPRTVTLGALICLADMIQVFMLNMTYDVPVKLLSFHLILLVLFLLAPEFPRLVNFFFLNRAAEPSTEARLFNTRRANRIALTAQIIFGLWLVGMNAHSSWKNWYTYGGGRPKSPLYGIWDVEQLSIDGQLRSPLLIDYGRWRRAIFDVPARMAFQRMDESFAYYGASIDVDAKTLAVTKDHDKNWKANFTFVRGAPDRLSLDGDMDGHKMHMQLQLVDHNQFLVSRRGFHWIQEYPYNR